MGYFYLAIAILGEVTGTIALKASEEFTKPIPSAVVVIAYGVSFYFLSLVLKTIPVGIAYAIWAGVGVVLIASLSAMVFRQLPDGPAVIGMCLIVLGVAVINIFSKNIPH